jgi:hypothetical protein
VDVVCCGKVSIVEKDDKVLIYLLGAMFLLTFDIRFSLHSDRAEGKSNPCIRIPRSPGRLHFVTSVAVVINIHLCAYRHSTCDGDFLRRSAACR